MRIATRKENNLLDQSTFYFIHILFNTLYINLYVFTQSLNKIIFLYKDVEVLVFIFYVRHAQKINIKSLNNMVYTVLYITDNFKQEW